MGLALVSLSVIMLLVNMFYADLIVPIFNKLTPLETGSLREKIESYTNKGRLFTEEHLHHRWFKTFL